MSFSRYATDDSVISSDTVVAGAWGNGTNTLNTFYTSSTANQYYTNVYYQDPSTNPSASVQFAIQYGHLNGSGSSYINSSVPGVSPSRIIYGEYRNLVYGTETQNFSLDGGTTTLEDIYVINVARSSYKESFNPNSLIVTIKGDDTVQRNFVDDSTYYNNTRFIGENRYFNLIQSGFPTRIIGLVFPDLDIIVISPQALYDLYSGTYTLPNRTANTAAYNQNLLYGRMNGTTTGFVLQSSETISSRYFFTRVKNSEFNYTTNPSIIDSSGNLIYNTLVDNPQTFITTVGLYNDNNELLAVAKMSKPLTKDFTKEALMRIKLDY
jgi:hypothetical protein